MLANNKRIDTREIPEGIHHVRSTREPDSGQDLFQFPHRGRLGYKAGSAHNKSFFNV
jgi:hypothetical protein